ncbi:class I adenylate-forming enzyme family protein [Nocardioides bizhenqiangii]|uniref:AMP-binding protein n=1 Tax=Nocardioides bizhenqiangii TaxID=3095076 RepID=A0ABZ0ZRN9_9ACTN|nr:MULTISPECIES: AMP-binding protein [unclassified Nocardioides]MDZ5622693.1 AMP-binding protein [Nocardioides sp. HM23]WQQ26960.1 AMP-binding protein [Nocardioides sp. HM61]
MSVPDVAALVATAAAESGDRLAVVEAGGRGMTWSDLDAEVSRVASGLGAAGIVAGHRVLLAIGNRMEFVTAYLGVLRAQAVAVPVNPASTRGELTRMLADSGARMAIADPDTVGAVRQAVAAAGNDDARPVRTVVVGAPAEADELSYDDLRAAVPREVPPLPDPEKLAVLLYTSGTSGLPRAVMLTHRALVANIEQVATLEPPMIHSDDVVLGVLPLFHVYGLNAVLGGVLKHRAKLVLAERFDPEGTLDLIEDEACSVVPVAPPVFAHWRGVDALEERLGPVRLVLSGSAPLAADVIDEFTDRTGVPVHQGYGLTEAAPVVTTTLRSEKSEPGSVGSPLDGIELRLVDDERMPLSGADLSDPGEIEIRGANLFSGYWPDGADGPDSDGWWPTGDVGVLDAAGGLHLVDRVKELVIVSGFNVYPTEVEAVLLEVPGVAEAAVIGTEDEFTGEAVVAYVVPTDPDADRDRLAAAVDAHCGERLARFKRPSRLEIVAELPHTGTGKVQKGRLRGQERRRALGLIE